MRRIRAVPPAALVAALQIGAALWAAAPAEVSGPAPGQAAGEAAAARERSARGPEALLEECRSPDLFFRERAESRLRRTGAEALPALARALDDRDPDFRLRMGRIFRDALRQAMEGFEADSMALLRDGRDLETLRKLRTTLPAAMARLKEEIAALQAPEADPEKDRARAAERAEKSQRLRISEETLKDASDERIQELESRLQERTKRSGESRQRILDLGAAAFGSAVLRRESMLPEILPACDALLKDLREAGPGEDLFPLISAAPGKSGRPEDPFERRRYILSALWAWETDRKGPRADSAERLLALHMERTVGDLGAGSSLLRDRAEEDLYVLGTRGIGALQEHGARLAPGQAERLQSLLLFRIEPRLAERTGMDFRDYKGLPFRARRRAVIHYARVAVREAVPTLRRIAFDETLEPSLLVRLVAAETLAGPDIRDRSAIKIFEQIALPQLLKIPEIAREIAVINGIRLTEEKRYEEAIGEFRKVLDEVPYDFEANYRIGFAYLLMKEYAKAILHLEIARRIKPGDELTLYNLACAYSLDGQIGKALDALEAAVEAGFNDDRHMEQDPDLASLRQDPRFHALIDRLRRGSEAVPAAPEEPVDGPPRPKDL